MQEEDYSFVTLDNEDDQLTNAIVVDVDSDASLGDFVMLDDDANGDDFITLSDDTIMLSDADLLDIYSTDIDGTDISFIL